MKSTHQTFHLNNFDFIRLMTAFLVLINHSFAHLQLPEPAWYGVIKPFQPVPMFFVMSGFLISASLERNADLQQYFTNRFSRIYPALWVCLLITIIFFSVLGPVSFFHAETLPWLFAQMAGFIYTPSFLDQFGLGSYNGSLWTIFVELQFYVFLPVIYLVYKRLHLKGNRFFIALFVLSVLLAYFLRLPNLTGATSPVVQKFVRYSLVSHAYLFFAGVLLQRFKLYASAFIRGKALYWIAGFLLFTYVAPSSLISYVIAMLILACCTISLGYTLPGYTSRWLRNRDISYGVFLYHGVILNLLVEWNLLGNYWYIALIAGVTVLLAWWSYRLIEAPALVWARKDRRVVQGNINLI